MQKAAILARVRKLCLALPEATEKLSHGSPTFFVKKTFVMYLDDHHGDGRLALWCAAAPGVQAEMVDQEPDRFFVPPYVGGRPRSRLGRDRRDRRGRVPRGRAEALARGTRRALTDRRTQAGRRRPAQSSANKR